MDTGGAPEVALVVVAVLVEELSLRVVVVRRQWTVEVRQQLPVHRVQSQLLP